MAAEPSLEFGHSHLAGMNIDSKCPVMKMKNKADGGVWQLEYCNKHDEDDAIQTPGFNIWRTSVRDSILKWI